MTVPDRTPEFDPAPGPALARAVFGDSYERAAAYARLLATEGIERGLLGPREVDRLWDRHLINCAVVAELLPGGSRVVDVGSGAGLPGVVLAILRPDLTITLLEPLARRAAFLVECRERLGLVVDVHRGRAEDPEVIRTIGGADRVTARAVARLDQLVRWCLPLLRPGGRLIAIKGESARDELLAARPAIARSGGVEAAVGQCGRDVAAPPTTVITVSRGTVPAKLRGGRAR